MLTDRSRNVVHHPLVADVGEGFISPHTLCVLGSALDSPDGGVAVLPLLPGLRVAGAEPGVAVVPRLGGELRVLRLSGCLVTAGILTSKSGQSARELEVT